jgi:phage terminase small subunit
MPVLPNIRREKFAQNIAAGQNASEAYAGAGFEAKSSIRINALRLTRDPKVAARILELRERKAVVIEQTTGITRAYVVERLKLNLDMALAAAVDNPSAGNVANRALELLGRELGMFVDRKKVTITSLAEASDEELAALLATSEHRPATASIQ